jgi:hypothetical protein
MAMLVGPVAIVLGTIVLLLGLFALAAVLLARSSHRRAEPGSKRPPEPPTDPWQEAGRRLAPPEAGTDD